MDFLFAPSPAVADCVCCMAWSSPSRAVAYVLPAGMHSIILVILRAEIHACRPRGTQPMVCISF